MINLKFTDRHQAPRSVPGLSSAAVFDSNALQPREIIVKKDDDPTGRKSGQSEPILSAIEDLPNALAVISEEHRPSRMPFFERLAGLPRAVARDPALLGQIHLVYQSAMHATRAAVYYLPHLDSPALRKRKLQIFIDDDGLPGGDTHHYQLTRAFLNIGAKSVLQDEEFADLEELCCHLDSETM